MSKDIKVVQAIHDICDNICAKVTDNSLLRELSISCYRVYINYIYNVDLCQLSIKMKNEYNIDISESRLKEIIKKEKDLHKKKTREGIMVLVMGVIVSVIIYIYM